MCEYRTFDNESTTTCGELRESTSEVSGQLPTPTNVATVDSVHGLCSIRAK